MTQRKKQTAFVNAAERQSKGASHPLPRTEKRDEKAVGQKLRSAHRLIKKLRADSEVPPDRPRIPFTI